MADRAFILLLLISSVYGCSSIRHGQLNDQQYSRFAQDIYIPEPEEWSLDNFRPDEGVVLVDGVDAEISIDMRASGHGWYEIRLSHDNNQAEPYEILITAEDGDDIGVFVTPKWSVPVYGLNEEIIITLYAVHKTKAGKTVTRTLLKQYKRRYDLICNQNEFMPVLFVKKLLKFCREQN
ncbi:MAG: hypothetical protein AB2535_16425 [Candidatus Thiodiazotropha endolucinida]